MGHFNSNFELEVILGQFSNLRSFGLISKFQFCNTFYRLSVTANAAWNVRKLHSSDDEQKINEHNFDSQLAAWESQKKVLLFPLLFQKNYLLLPIVF